ACRTPARCSPRRGCAARCRACARACIRWWSPERRNSSDVVGRTRRHRGDDQGGRAGRRRVRRVAALGGAAGDGRGGGGRAARLPGRRPGGRARGRLDVLLDLCCLNEIVEHAAGDLVVRAQAGVTMDALADRLAGSGQELALDVPFPEGTTIGGTLAAAVAGPRAFRYGTARDLLIG